MKEREENFRQLAENLTSAITITNDSNDRLYFNSKLPELTGYTSEELRNQKLLDIVQPSEQGRVRDIRKKRIAHKPAPKHYETSLLTKDGTIVPIEVTSTRTIWQDQPADIAVYYDLTERKMAEERENWKEKPRRQADWLLLVRWQQVFLTRLITPSQA